MRSFLRNLSSSINFLIITSIFLLILGYYKISGLPKENEILSDLSEAPIQSQTSRDKFEFNYQGQDYIVEPLYDYELTGLIVTHNNISSITDAYHTSKSVDLKDLCVIWGDNFKNNIHKELKFWSEAWSCVYQFDSHEEVEKFRSDQLSNNHLLSNSAYVRERIKKAKIGDQIKFTGMLVNYYPKRFPDMIRKSSTIRTDTGNGACEVVFVEDFQILKTWKKEWSYLYSLASSSALILILIKGISFLVFPYLEYRFMN